MFGPYEGDYGKDGNQLPLWELVPKPEEQGIDVNRYSVSFRWRGEKSKKCPLALASDLKNYTKVTVPTTATEGTDGLDNGVPSAEWRRHWFH